jgi:hypothetical protein
MAVVDVCKKYYFFQIQQEFPDKNTSVNTVDASCTDPIRFDKLKYIIATSMLFIQLRCHDLPWPCFVSV